MTSFRFGTLIIISHFVASLLSLSGVSYGNDVTLRKAATPSASSSVRNYKSIFPEGFRHPMKKTRIGLSPIPFKPTRPGARPSEPLVHQGNFPDIRAIVRKVNRSVVAIRMVDPGSSFSLGHLGFSGDSGAKAMGYGSGFIVSSNGLIITNEHVLRNGSQIEIELLNGQRYVAKVLHKNSKNDLALLKIDASNLQPVTLGDSDAVELGEWVVGIGNPYGIGQSLMIGIVSAQKRTIPGSGYPPLIQIDAAMNLGNSGGPLFNLDGKVIGINTILLWKSQGIGFATPINIAREFLARKNYPPVKAASASALEPLGAAPDDPRSLPERFNPLDPPWKFQH
ncbi:MAG: trypsin-like peptidase domain-containing protein [Desulfomonilaceae bacterium]